MPTKCRKYPYPVLALLLLQGCLSDDQPSRQFVPCTESWYQHVEMLLITGDGRGHGPDPGSDEWKSVVEFKLGIRGDAGVPNRTTEKWCEFIDKLLESRQ